MKLQAERPQNIQLCLPESFEWLLLKSGIIHKKIIEGVIENPHSADEDRFRGIGCINGLLIIITTFTERNRTRIISCQRADKAVREVYDDYVRKING